MRWLLCFELTQESRSSRTLLMHCGTASPSDGRSRVLNDFSDWTTKVERLRSIRFRRRALVGRQCNRASALLAKSDSGLVWQRADG